MNIRLGAIADVEALTELEAKCFPSAEAATRESFQKRLQVFPNHFWILEEDGEMISLINGMVTDESSLRDEMYECADLHKESGKWQMIFGVETSPEYQHKGYAQILMRQVIEDCKKQGRLGIVLTCKERLVPFYEQFGFVDEGKSDSEHGGVSWNEMRLTF